MSNVRRTLHGRSTCGHWRRARERIDILVYTGTFRLITDEDDDVA
ncbi:MAG: hypothetical protein ACK5MR_02100 [Cumulibacter sp.]